MAFTASHLHEGKRVVLTTECKVFKPWVASASFNFDFVSTCLVVEDTKQNNHETPEVRWKERATAAKTVARTHDDDVVGII